jgi:hypothetical protein
MLVDMVSGFIPQRTIGGMTIQKIIQIRYRNPRHMLEIFWADDVFGFGTTLRFIGCRIMRIAPKEGSGLFKNYHEKLKAITIPHCIDPILDTAEMPAWWNHSRREAEEELMMMASNPIGTEISHQMFA